MQLILVINRRTRIEYYANKFSTLIPIKPLGLIVHSLCFFGVYEAADNGGMQILLDDHHLIHFGVGNRGSWLFILNFTLTVHHVIKCHVVYLTL